MAIKRHLTSDELTRLFGTGPVVPTVSTVGVGLPSFASRNQGDLHYDTAASKEYVLTGVGGAGFTDTFDRADSTAGLGVTDGGAGTWLYLDGATTFQILGGKAQSQGVVGGTHFAYLTVASGNAVCSATLKKELTVPSAFQGLTMRCTGNDQFSGYHVVFESDGGGDLFQIRRNGANLYSTSLNTMLGGTSYGNRWLAGVDVRMVITGLVVQFYIDGLLAYSYTEASAVLTGLNSGLFWAAATNAVVSWNNFYSVSSGTLAWTPTSTTIEANYANATATGTVTLPDVDVATLNRITLTGNVTFVFPALGVGKSFTVVVLQDATGSHTVTWPAEVVWPGGTAPTVTATGLRRDVFTFLCENGLEWLGFVAGQNYV